LVAVTKQAPIDFVQGLYDLGVRRMAENRPQQLWEKAAALPSDVRWHMVGRFQTNKIARTLPAVALVHSVDRRSLAEALSAEAARAGIEVRCLLQVNVTGEETKGGFAPDEVAEVLAWAAALPGLRVDGLMTMARYEDEAEACRPTFQALRRLRDSAANRNGVGDLPILSMGMSNDFEPAVEEGATHVRIGSALFEGVGPSPSST
ncbi:MAG: YggS family pyridoxal phosphate-dependent enzyme, partial [Planctomycetia bacterium]